MPSEIEHWHIDATVYKDRVEEVHYVSDPAQNIRRRPETIVWQVERFLGRGTFGEVRLERNKGDGRFRAVKRIATTNPSLNNRECERELKALLEFSKPKSREAAVFVDFLGWFKDQSDVFLAMEYLPLGDLETNVQALSGRLPGIEAQEITEQILSGLDIMHAESFAHRDLKPQNILVVHGSPQWWIKIADFGLSKRLTEGTMSYTRGGSLPYMAPEVLGYIDTSAKYTNAIDIWAVGCIVFRLLVGRVPFPMLPSLGEYCTDNPLFLYDALFGSGIREQDANFIQELLVPDPSRRLSASEALQHRWFSLGSQIPTSTVERPLTPGRISETMSQIRFDTASHAGLHSYRFARSSEGKLEAPQSSESVTDRDRERARADDGAREAALRQMIEEERRRAQEQAAIQADKPMEDEMRERLYNERKSRDMKEKRRFEKIRTRQAYVEDGSSDEEISPAMRAKDMKAQKQMEEDREAQAAAWRAEAACIEHIRAKEVRAAKLQPQGVQIREAPMDPRWSDHIDFAGAYMAAARRKIAVEEQASATANPFLPRAQTFTGDIKDDGRGRKRGESRLRKEYTSTESDLDSPTYHSPRPSHSPRRAPEPTVYRVADGRSHPVTSSRSHQSDLHGLNEPSYARERSTSPRGTPARHERPPISRNPPGGEYRTSPTSNYYTAPEPPPVKPIIVTARPKLPREGSGSSRSHKHQAPAASYEQVKYAPTYDTSKVSYANFGANLYDTARRPSDSRDYYPHREREDPVYA